MPIEYLAHSSNSAGKEHLLKQHLSCVAEIASKLSQAAPWREEARLAGLLHDLGKYGGRFQARLRGEAQGIDHWSAGAWIACTKFRAIAAALAVQGHHIGLQRFLDSGDLRNLDPQSLAQHHPIGLTLSHPDPQTLLDRAIADGLSLASVPARRVLTNRPVRDLAAYMLDVRLLFSVLADADFLDTEAHFRGDQKGKRYRSEGPQLPPADALDAVRDAVEQRRRASDASEDVRRLRDDLWEACQSAADGPLGLWTLSAPTGSGKTLAMLGFALRHAAVHGLRRVVCVIPYLTIIEQTAAEYRRIFEPTFGPEFVLEHHSLADVGQERDQQDAEDESRRRRRLLAENWDAPIIVTTSVQLLESLFSNRPSSCRKLHALMESVILFDEVQTLPAALALPTLATLSRLASTYRTSVVLATATQPAFDHLSPEVKTYYRGGWQPVEIAALELKLFDRVRRTKIHSPKDGTAIGWDHLCDKLRSHDQVLCIVNLKRHAREIVEKLGADTGDDLFHLSTNMCPAHRQDTLAEVRRRLGSHSPSRCRLISTQCIEAGVDVDFPVVYRAFGPLEAIAQAAGRCNREGRRATGDVFVFQPAEQAGRSGYPTPAYAQAAAVTALIVKERQTRSDTLIDIDNPDLYRAYYRRLYDLVHHFIITMTYW